MQDSHQRNIVAILKEEISKLHQEHLDKTLQLNSQINELNTKYFDTLQELKKLKSSSE